MQLDASNSSTRTSTRLPVVFLLEGCKGFQGILTIRVTEACQTFMKKLHLQITSYIKQIKRTGKKKTQANRVVEYVLNIFSITIAT
jgi:hypothetical protein